MNTRNVVIFLIIITFLGIGFTLYDSYQTPLDDMTIVHSEILGQYFYGIDQGKIASRRIHPIITILDEAGALGAYTTGETPIDFIEVATTIAGMASDSNPNLKIVGTLIKPRGDDAIVIVKLDSPIISLGDLRGKTIGVDNIALTPTVLLRELLKQNHNIRYNEVTYIERPLSSLLGALDRGEVDAVVVYSAYAYFARAQEDKYRVLSNVFEETKPILGDLPIAAVLVTTREQPEERREVYRRGLGLIRLSFEYGSEHKDEISPIMAGNLGLLPEVYVLTFYNVVPTDIYLNAEDKVNILMLLKIAEQQGLIERTITEDIFFDP